MATRKSGFYDSVYYTTTRRGRPTGSDMGYEMFPEKYEKTEVHEDPDELYNHYRTTLKDYTPDQENLMASGEPRRDTHAREKINLRSGGARVNTMPYANENFDLQFHDEDPRGWSTEQPWGEYRRVIEGQLNRIDFKDDGDYSVPGTGIHPNTMYKQIRGAQDWVKARLKIFSTSKDNFHNGGIGKYKWYDKSSAEKVDFEETSVNIDQRYDSYPERMNKTSELSNIVNLGSKMLRTNTTTDQLVQVSTYGKLFRSKGLIPHEAQMRIVEDDTRWGNVFKEDAKVNRQIASMLSMQVNRDAMQNVERGQKSGAESFSAQNRSQKLSDDIISLMGLTHADVKYLESAKSQNRKGAERALAQLKDLQELLHAIPANMKIQIRDELALKSGGAHLRPTGDGGRQTRTEVILNPKIREFMRLQASKNADRTANPEDLMREAVADSEGKLNHKLAGTPVYIYKNADVEDIDANRREANGETKKSLISETKVVSYKSLSQTATDQTKNQHEGLQMQQLADSMREVRGITQKIGETLRNVGDVNTARVDNNFGDNLTKTRHGGRMGSKDMRRSMDTDTARDAMSDRSSVGRKNMGRRDPGTSLSVN